MRSQILVAGVDSSTQACKIVVRDASSGLLVREGRAPHPPGTEVDPAAWLEAFELASERAGGLDDVAALGVAAQQHGAVCLTEDGKVVRPAMLWNDLRSGRAADDLVAELGGGEEGRRAWADAVGLVPVASFTVTKLRWIAEHEPALAATTAAVCLPHDWLTWQLMASDGSGGPGIARLTTDRGDASGTGYWSATSGRYRLDILERAFGSRPIVPRVVDPSGRAGLTVSGAVLAAGTGDNAAAALGVGAGPGDVVVSIGTSGTVSAVADAPVVDASGTVAGFADATGRHLPLVCTVNASRVLERIAAILRVGQDELSALALSAPPGAGGLVLVPYLEGERTPNRPDATGALLGLDLANTTPAHLARAAVEGMLCGLADGLDALRDLGVPVRRILLVGGASRSDAVRRIAPSVLGQAVVVPPPGEYVADGAARQAAWALDPAQDPPSWPRPGTETYEAEPCPQVRDAYAAAREHALDRERGHQLVAPPA